MSVRVAVHAEGSRETGVFALRPRPGSVLREDDLGAAHIITRRSLIASAGFPEPAVRLIEPLRLGTGHVARGSSLIDRNVLRKLLAWPDPATRPDLAVVLVDADGHPDRVKDLVEWTKDAMVQPVIGVAVQEFEAWLVADDASVSSATGVPFPTAPAPESMRPREAKNLFEEAVARGGCHSGAARRSVAALLDLEVVGRRCPAFRAFRAELARAAAGLV